MFMLVWIIIFTALIEIPCINSTFYIRTLGTHTYRVIGIILADDKSYICRNKKTQMFLLVHLQRRDKHHCV